MRGHLGLLEVRLTSSLTNSAFILTAWSDHLIIKLGLVARDRWKLEWLISLNFEVKLLNSLEGFEIIKANDGSCINLLHEARNVCLVLERKFDVRKHLFLVEEEFESHIVDLFFAILVSSADLSIETAPPVFRNILLTFLARCDFVLVNPFANFHQSLAGTHLGDQLVGNL